MLGFTVWGICVACIIHRGNLSLTGLYYLCLIRIIVGNYMCFDQLMNELVLIDSTAIGMNE